MIHVLLLAFNEEAGISPCLNRLKEVLSARSEPFRFVVVDDGSTDRTAELVRSLSKSLPITLLQHPKNLGVARGFDTGLRHIAQTASPDDAIVTLEADNTNDPAYLLEMLKTLQRGYDVVCASRYRKGGRYVGFPFKRLLCSLGANWIMRLLFPVNGVRDYTIFFRVYRARVVAEAIRRFQERFIERRGFTANAEILFKIAEASPILCSEVPLVYRYDLKKGGSKMKVGGNIREYGTLFSSLLRAPAGLALRQTLVLFILSLGLGLWGMGWGLPDRERIETLLPEALRSDPAFLQRLARHREELYERMESNQRISIDRIEKAEVLPAGWTFPPERLLSPCRSYYLRSENADEQKNLTYLAHMRPRQLKFEPYAASYGGAFIYALGAWYALAAGLGAVHVTTDVLPYLQDASQMVAIFKVGRLFNVLSFAVCSVLLASMARSLGTGMAGWLAGLIFLFLPVTAIVSHTINPYGWATLWSLVMCRSLFRYLERGETGDWVAAAIGFGMCFGSSIAFWTLWFLFPPVFFLRMRRGADIRGESQVFLKASLLSAFVFFATNPYLFLKFKVYQAEMEYALYAFPFSLTFRWLWKFGAGFLGFNMGVVATISALAAVVWHGFRRRAPAPVKLMAVMFIVGYVLLSMRVIDPSHGRHFLPFVAIACCLIAYGATAVRSLRSRAVAWIALTALFVENVPASASYLWNMGLEARGVSTRMESARWINENLPGGSSVGLLFPPQPYYVPPFRFDRHRLVLFREPAQLSGRRLPDYIVVSGIEGMEGRQAFFEGNYRLLRGFEPRRLVPWIRVRGDYAVVGARINVFIRRDL